MDEIKLIVQTEQEYVRDKRLTFASATAAVENASEKGVGTVITKMKNPSSTYEM